MGMGRVTRSIALSLALALSVGTLVEVPQVEAQQQQQTRRRRARRARRPPPPPQEPEHGPTPGCPPECYSSCGGGAAVDPTDPPTERQQRCAGCRSICQDTGRYPPGAPR